MIQDVRCAFRSLRKSSGTTIIAVLTIAIGVGANTAIFSVVRAVLLKPPPYADVDRLVFLQEKRPSARDGNAISALNYLDWAHQNTVFEQIAGIAYKGVTIGGRGQPVYVAAQRVSAPYFNILGINAAIGRTFASDEDQPGKAHVAILSYRLWVSRFGSDRGVIGATIRVDGEPCDVIGVMPAGTSVDLTGAELWTPPVFDAEALTRSFHSLGWAVAKVKPGVTLRQARAEMDTIGERLALAHPESNKDWGVLVQPFPRRLVNQNFEQSLYVLFLAVGVVLLIGCANLANLALARGVTREREVAIRTALGASRRQIVQLLLTENMVIAVLGGACGLVLGDLVLAAIKARIPPYAVPPETPIGMDAPVWLFVLVVSALSGILFGLAPALAVTRAGWSDTMSVRDASTSRASLRLRNALVTAEVAVTFVLLTSAVLLIRSVVAMQRTETGFTSTNVLTAELPVAENRFDSPDALNAYLNRITASVRAIPGVRDVAFADALPMQGPGQIGRLFQIADQPVVNYINRPLCGFKIVSPSYFRALDLRILRGRALDASDRAGAPFVIVINQTMARLFFPQVDPIGKRILMRQIPLHANRLGPEVAWQVVGVMADERLSPLSDTQEHPAVYATNEQSPTLFQSMVVRATLDPTRLTEPVRKAVTDVDRDQAITNIKPLDELKIEYTGSDRLRSVLLGLFAAVALVLAALGLYGVIAHSVVQRTQEMGIRAALGASPSMLLGMILRQGLTLTGWGVAVGVGATFYVTRLLVVFLFGVRPFDPMTLLIVGCTLALVSLIACYVPARRAAQVNPLVALRT